MKNMGNNFVELMFGCPCPTLIEDLQKVYNEIGDPSLADFQSEFGGGFYLIESYDDLKNIMTVEMNEDGSHKNLTQTAALFDVCFPIDENYIQIMLCTNDAGGDTYLIPNDIAKRCPYVQESIALTIAYARSISRNN
jgi:hypothetical protein